LHRQNSNSCPLTFNGDGMTQVVDQVSNVYEIDVNKATNTKARD